MFSRTWKFAKPGISGFNLQDVTFSFHILTNGM